MTQIITNNWWGGSWVWVYKYKWSVNSYEDLPSSWMKIWDVYNVVNEHTTAPVFPAWTNVAWTGTEWDALWWSIDFSEYQKKLVEWAWIDIDWDTNEISVESTVINWAAAWATAVQPWDDISDLNNDAGYITSSDIPTNVSAFNNDAWYITSSDIPTNVSAFNNDAGYLVSSDLKQSNWGQTDSSAIDYIKNKPTIWNATLTIQRNWTTVNSITMNSTSNVTANISVPTKVSDLSNDSWFITKDVNDLTNYTKTSSLWAVALSNNYSDLSNKPDLSVYQTTANLVTDLNNADDTHYPSAKAVSDAITSSGGWDMLKSVYDPNNISANAFDYNNFINTPTIPSVIDDLTSLSTTDALSANQWKVLKDAIDNLSWLWKFLSLWNSSTGQPISFPLATPYTYTTWDWFMVETLWATNYKPTWSSYTWTASTVVESWTVKQWDVYIYDGTDWLLQVNNEPQVSFSEIAWQPTDNSNLATALNAKQNTLTAGENIKISSNVISANNVFIITEDDVTVSTTQEYWVAPYNTSYYYTNIDISASAGIEWREWAIYTFVVDTEMVVASAYRNVRVKIWNWTYIPVMWTTAVISWSSYFTKTNIRQFQYTTKYEAGWALHLFTDSNTTYSAMSVAEWKTATATSVRWMRSDYLKQIIKYHSVDDTAYASSWNGVTDIAPSKNAVYDKIQSVVSSIPTVNNATLTIQKNGTNVQTFTANQSTNATANITVPTDTSDLTNWAWFITWITSWDVTTALWYTPANDSSVVKTSWNQSIAWTKTFSTSPVVPSKTTDAWNNATTIATEAQVYKKQDKLTTQTAYTSKWTSTKVPTITTNTLWQVTAISETAITFPVTSVNWSTWAVTGLQTTSNLKTSLTDNSDSYYPSQKAVKTAVDSKQPTLVSWTNIKTVNNTSLLGSGNIAINEVPSSWTTWYVLTKTSSWYWWSAPTGWSKTITVTLTSAWWSSNSQTVSATWVTASNTVIVSPAPSDIADYADCGVYCSAQGSGTLTFGCDTVPSGDIVVNVLIMS